MVECDPSIKSIIVKLDSERHEFIVEELDDQTLVIKENMLSILKMRLEDVSIWKRKVDAELIVSRPSRKHNNQLMILGLIERNC